LLPYLVVKHEQAELALHWVELAPGVGHHDTNSEQRAVIREKLSTAKKPWRG